MKQLLWEDNIVLNDFKFHKSHLNIADYFHYVFILHILTNLPQPAFKDKQICHLPMGLYLTLSTKFNLTDSFIKSLVYQLTD